MAMNRDIQDRMLARRQGVAGGRTTGRASDVLHKISTGPRPDGIDVRRIEALADLIETLPLFCEDIPVKVLKFVTSDTKVTHYHMPSKKEFGVLHAKDTRNLGDTIDVYALNFNGLCHWGWGHMGLAAVADGPRKEEVHRVAMARPVIRDSWAETPPVRMRGGVTPRHVAEALREYVKCLDPVKAWQKVAAWADAEADRPAAEPMKIVPIRENPVIERKLPPAAKVTNPERVLQAAKERLDKDLDRADALEKEAAELRKAAEEGLRQAKGQVAAAMLMRGDDHLDVMQKVYGTEVAR